MPKKKKNVIRLFSAGTGGLIVVALLAAGLHGAGGKRQAAARMQAPASFAQMERPDPVTLLTPVRLPDRRSARR